MTAPDRRAWPGAAFGTRRVALAGVLAFGVGVVVLAGVLLAGGGAPQPMAEGLPDAGPITGWGLPLVRFAYDLCAIATVGALVTGVVLTPRDTPERTACLHAAAGWALGWTLCGVATYLLTISSLVGTPPGEVLADPSLLTFGATFPETQAVLFALAAAVVVASGARTFPGWTLLVAAVLGLLPPVYAGHAASSGDHEMAISGLTLHLVAVAVWVGGLAAVLLHFRRSDRLTTVLPRFSTLALVCFAGVAVSGVASAWVRLGSVADLWQTPYGLVVVAKAGVLAALGAFGWAHRRRTVAGIGERPVRHTFLRLAAGEAVVMAAAVALAVGLSRTPPPVLEGGGHGHGALGFELAPFSLAALVTEIRPDPLVLFVLAVPAAGYLVGLRRLARDGVPWPPGRTLAWFAGLAVLALVLLCGAGGYARAMLAVHAVQYAVLGVVAPLLLAFGAPLTLAAQATSPRSQYGDAATAVLDGRLAARITHPAVLAVLYAAPFALLYGTGWLTLSASGHAYHLINQAVFLGAGLLCAWVLAGVDPLPRPVTWTTRAALLALVAAVQVAVGLLLLAGPPLATGWFFLAAPPGYADLAAGQRTAGLVFLVLPTAALAVPAVRLARWRRSARRTAAARDSRV
ncbi:copper resistance protein D [Microtetraspora sp. NBRC 13810]|uniref:cytochrome c oxidase assembly protein n=1 Tax=Microtetraspora sp. NBRC 13810 TaxID=3030990 RepID=UPI00249FDD26|nr:cytochrome c oxidase assembly protein [Microtetraspora sp. NBRC 13810]GLW06415.1 copper resistance protein D [Microtetraspora sp. NBRC 13810]